jgi:dihydrofolate reductase
MNAIFAVNSLDGFGTGSDMPWTRNSTDLQRFKKYTTGHTVVMGSGTWNSNMPKPLPNRRNIVLSSQLKDDRCEVYSSVTELLMNIKQEEQVFVIGGAKLLWILRNYINKIYMTRFMSCEKCEIVLDTEQYLNGFSLLQKETLDNHTFEIYEKIL